MTEDIITSTANPQVRAFVHLRDKARERRQKDLFVAEGRKMLEEAPRDRITAVYASETFIREEGREDLLRSLPVQPVSDSVMRAMSDTPSPQGVICVLRQFHYQMEDLLAADHPLCLVLENLQDPGNLGTIVRTAEGAGVSGILLGKGCADIYNPKVIRSTMGSVYRMPFFYANDLRLALLDWKRRGIRLFAAHLHGRNTYDREDYRGSCAFLIGNEGNGLTQETADMADTLVKIPMEGKVESLNAGIAAAVLMYEAARQRRSR